MDLGRMRKRLGDQCAGSPGFLSPSSKPGDVFDLQFSIRLPRQRKQKVETVDPSDDILTVSDAPIQQSFFRPAERRSAIWSRAASSGLREARVVMGAFPDSTSSMNCSISTTAASGRRTVFSSWAVPSGVARSAPMSNKRLWHRCR